MSLRLSAPQYCSLLPCSHRKDLLTSREWICVSREETSCSAPGVSVAEYFLSPHLLYSIPDRCRFSSLGFLATFGDRLQFLLCQVDSWKKTLQPRGVSPLVYSTRKKHDLISGDSSLVSKLCEKNLRIAHHSKRLPSPH